MTLTIGDMPDTDFDVVVVGSGFGGSVSAYRLAEAGLRVCVLERGKSYPPGAFARTPAEFARNLWDPSAGLHGLFDVWSFKGIEAVTAAGVGGGSLIYANVFIRKDESWFVHEHPYRRAEKESWPVTRADLDPHYDRVEDFLQIQTLPTGDGATSVPKYDAIREAAASLGEGTTWAPAPLAVRFRGSDGQPLPPGSPLPPSGYGSLFGDLESTRRTCRLCGECCIGCNDGSKNTLDHTYLSAASHHGAIVSERSQVVAIRRVAGYEGGRDGGYEVDYVVHLPEHEGRSVPTRTLPRHTLTARRVVLGAGAIGSTYLLLRNRVALGISSPALGTRYCGNGDLLGFVLDADTPGGGPQLLDGSTGPAITSYIRWPDDVDTGNPSDFGFYLEDAGYPYFLQWLLESAAVPAALGRAARVTGRRFLEAATGLRRTSLSRDVADLLSDGRRTATSVPLLGMGRDVADGRLYLGDPAGPGRERMLESSWTVKTSSDYYEFVKSKMEWLAGALGGRFMVNPSYLLRRLITVHSLGGCPMGDDPDQSVVDTSCEVRGVPGLYVSDGAVFPGPIGPNPSFTIAAMADRMCDGILERG